MQNLFSFDADTIRRQSAAVDRRILRCETCKGLATSVDFNHRWTRRHCDDHADRAVYCDGSLFGGHEHRGPVGALAIPAGTTYGEVGAL